MPNEVKGRTKEQVLKKIDPNLPHLVEGSTRNRRLTKQGIRLQFLRRGVTTRPAPTPKHLMCRLHLFHHLTVEKTKGYECDDGLEGREREKRCALNTINPLHTFWAEQAGYTSFSCEEVNTCNIPKKNFKEGKELSSLYQILQ